MASFAPPRDLMPPAALISSIAILTASSICLPSPARAPVSGWMEPILMTRGVELLPLPFEEPLVPPQAAVTRMTTSRKIAAPDLRSRAPGCFVRACRCVANGGEAIVITPSSETRPQGRLRINNYCTSVEKLWLLHVPTSETENSMLRLYH